MPSFLTSKQITHLLFGCVLVSYIGFSIYHIDQFITADEHYWVYERIPQYWNALAEKKWSKTFINDKPGVSLALVSGISYWLHPESKEHCEETADKTVRCHTENTGALYRDFRWPIVFTNAAMLVIIFFLVSRLISLQVGVWTAIFIGYSPLLIGFSQILNPDSLLWSTGTVGIFAFLLFLKEHQKKFLGVCVLATGLALLSKYVALILLPIYAILTLLFFLLNPRETTDTQHRKDLLILTRSVIIASLGSMGMLFLFLPAFLIDDKYIHRFLDTIPHRMPFFLALICIIALFFADTLIFKNRFLFFLRNSLKKFPWLERITAIWMCTIILITLVSRLAFPSADIWSKIPFDMKNFANDRYYGANLNVTDAFLLEWSPVVFSMTPIVLIGVLLFFGFMAFSKQASRLHAFLSIASAFIITFYLLVFLISDILLIPRYITLLYPLMAFMAALGYERLNNLWTFRFKNVAMGAFLIAGSLASLIGIAPYYTNYANFLLPKNALISDAWGYGGYEAAQYLNGLPNAEHLTVWADYNGVCEFLVGKCLTAYTFNKEYVRPDYYVLTRRGKIRYISRYDRWEEKSGLTAYQYYDTQNPDWQLFIDDRPENFIKVVKVNK